MDQENREQVISPDERIRVAALNEHFAELGRNPFGDLKFRWGHTTELHYFMLEMAPESEWTPVGEKDKEIRGFRCPACNHLTLEGDYYDGCKQCDTVLGIETFERVIVKVPLLMMPTYRHQAYQWAGPLGERWQLTYWQAPVPYDEWIASGRGNFPWPKHGEYLCIENVGMPPGQEPTELHTMAAIAGIKWQLELLGPTHAFDPKGEHPRLKNFIAEQKEKIAKHDEAVKNVIADEFDDGLPAFLKVPGSNGDGGRTASIPRPASQIIREGGTPVLQGE